MAGDSADSTEDQRLQDDATGSSDATAATVSGADAEITDAALTVDANVESMDGDARVGTDAAMGTGYDAGGAQLSPPSGCVRDDALECSGGGNGWTCAAGVNPQEESPIACSVPLPDGANDDFCCIPWSTSSTTCVPVDTPSFDLDSSFTCQFGSYAYQCAQGDDPTTLNASLACSSAVADPDGVHIDFCCE